MIEFAELVHRLFFTSGSLAKARILRSYIEKTEDPDRGWAIAILAGKLDLVLFKRSLINRLIKSRIDPYLFDLCYDYVGELSETVALLWPTPNTETKFELPSLTRILATLESCSKSEIEQYVGNLLDQMSPQQRWAFIKIGTGGLRVGMSARSVKRVLAEFGDVDLDDIEQLWHAIEPPYEELFLWLSGNSEKPDISGKLSFTPLMLAHPVDLKSLDFINPNEWFAEWKYDGIRVQLVTSNEESAIFSRSGENITGSFPELSKEITRESVLDGELVVMRDKEIGSFNDLQKRLNKKRPTKKDIISYPTAVIVYDVLSCRGESYRKKTLEERRSLLESFFKKGAMSDRLFLSPTLSFKDAKDLQRIVENLTKNRENQFEGLMIKKKASEYVSGRPKGEWFKWKKEPHLVDAVLMYAQRGHGKRSSFYSDYTFGLWDEGNLLPIGKAYFGFTDEELGLLDKWVRNNTVERFGPVRAVEPGLVLEIAFDSVHISNRHKSGVALRFPRVNRIRWDKSADYADHIGMLKGLIVN